jgi:intracellular sulfur oxidation DsrE/DsrF family protein
MPLELRRKQPRRMRIWIAIVAASVALIIGAAAAHGAVHATVKPTAVPLPDPTVTATPEPVTPDACLEALDLADETVTKLMDIVELVPDTVGAVLDEDPSAMERINRRFNTFNLWLGDNRPKYERLRAECSEG